MKQDNKFRPENIKKFREEISMSRAELAEELKKRKRSVTTRTIWNWESGATKPDAGILELMTQIFRKGIMLFFAPVQYKTSGV